MFSSSLITDSWTLKALDNSSAQAVRRLQKYNRQKHAELSVKLSDCTPGSIDEERVLTRLVEAEMILDMLEKVESELIVYFADVHDSDPQWEIPQQRSNGAIDKGAVRARILAEVAARNAQAAT